MNILKTVQLYLLQSLANYLKMYISIFMRQMNSFSLIKAMKNSGKENFLIDGFPRNKDNVDGWQKTMDGKAKVQCVLFFDCDEKVSIIVFLIIFIRSFLSFI